MNKQQIRVIQVKELVKIEQTHCPINNFKFEMFHRLNEDAIRSDSFFEVIYNYSTDIVI